MVPPRKRHRSVNALILPGVGLSLSTIGRTIVQASVLVLIDLAQHQRQEQACEEEAAVAAAVAGAKTANAHQPTDVVLSHNADPRARRG